MTDNKETKVIEQQYTVGAVATETQPVIVDNINNKHMDMYEAFAKILSDLEEIKKNIVGQ